MPYSFANVGCGLTEEKKRRASVLQLLEKAWIRSILTVFSVLLMIGGPTFLINILQRFGVPHLLLIFIGLASFVIGILFFIGLTREEKTT